MLGIGIIQVHRQRGRQRRREERETHCANCGSTIDFEAYETGETESDEWDVNYCTNCGAPVLADANAGPTREKRNCPDCGTPTDPEEGECSYCRTEL